MKKIITLGLIANLLAACSQQPVNTPEDPVAQALSKIPAFGEMKFPDREQYENCNDYKAALKESGYPATKTTETRIISKLPNGTTMTFHYPDGGCQ